MRRVRLWGPVQGKWTYPGEDDEDPEHHDHVDGEQGQQSRQEPPQGRAWASRSWVNAEQRQPVSGTLLWVSAHGRLN